MKRRLFLVSPCISAKNLALLFLVGITLMIISMPQVAGASIAFVQVNSVTPQSSVSSVTVSYPSAQTGGNLNIVVVGWNDSTSTMTSLSDSNGNTYAQAGTTQRGTNLTQAIYYAKNIKAGGNTVTVNFNQAATYIDVRILEYSGLDTSNPLDVTASAAGSSSSPNSGSATTTSANELIFGAGTTFDTFSGAGTGFTYRIITQDGDIAEDEVVSSTGNYSASAPLKNSSYWVMQMAAFKAASGVSVSISPTSASVQTGTTQQFTATVTGTTNTAVTWQVNGVTGGNSTVGTISTSGLYTAPSTVPNPANVTVTAVSQADPTKSASATVTLTTGPSYTLVFPGPFTSWINVQTQYGAKGDGTTDDTQALQNAINAAAQYTSTGTVTSGPVFVYLPAGTYRITATLQVKYQPIGILGADPTTTTLRWDGANGSDMLLANGVAASRFGRFRFDGAGKAGSGLHFAWDAVGPGQASTQAVELFDLVFYNLQKGIIGGGPQQQMDSDIGIFRTRFEQCSVAGLSVESPNAVDYWVRDSVFVNNARGLTNSYTQGSQNGGSFNVHNSIFQNSSVADVVVSQFANFLGLRDNYSSGSNQFLNLSPNYMAYGTTVQNNTILDTTNSVSIQANHMGDLILLDNRIRTKTGATGPAVVLDAGSGTADFLSVGNTYTVANAESLSGGTVRSRQLDDQVVDYSAINGTAPTLPPTPTPQNSPLLEVAAGSTDAAIQQAINQAVTYAGQHPIVHLPPGSYTINNSINVPANLDVIITGDGLGTVIWGTTSLNGNPVFTLQGPSRATLQDMKINASQSTDNNVVTNSEAIHIGGADQTSARVHGEVLWILHNTDTDVLAENLTNTHVNFEGLFIIRTGQTAGVSSIGTGTLSGGRVAVFGSTSAAWANPNAPMYKISNQGRIIVKDAWYEATDGPILANLDSSSKGNFTLNSAFSSQFSGSGSSPVAQFVSVNNYSGTATFLGDFFIFPDTNSGRYLTIQNQTSATALFSGSNAQEGSKGSANYIILKGSGGKVAIFSNKVDTQSSKGNVALPDGTPQPDDATLRSMLADLRGTTTETTPDLPAGTTDVRLYRLFVEYATRGLHVVH